MAEFWVWVLFWLRGMWYLLVSQTIEALLWLVQILNIKILEKAAVLIKDPASLLLYFLKATFSPPTYSPPPFWLTYCMLLFFTLQFLNWYLSLWP